VTVIHGREATHVNDAGIRGRTVRHCLPRADLVMAVSNSLRDTCIAMGVSIERVHVIGNAVDTMQFHPLRKDECRRRLGLPASDRVILAVGSLTSVKGHDRLIECLPAVLRRFPEAMLCIVGPNGANAGGDVTRDLRLQAGRLRVDNKVRFVGEIGNCDLIYWYNAADVFCLPSRSEGSPGVVLEALACGCPTVATDVGSVSEIISSDFLGVVVPNRDDGPLDGLIEALSREFDRARIALHARHFNWDAFAGRTCRLYDSLASSFVTKRTSVDRRPG
jgi:teichuronic acid biosynthesis glycosyltransferase TuaC